MYLEAKDAPGDLVLIPADVPDGIVEDVLTERLPPNWRSLLAPESLGRIGADWAQERRTAALSVPSAVMPVERNFLLNPSHPDFRRIAIGRPVPFSFDRMWKPGRARGRRRR
jgi:RES domain-containing protein